MVRISGVVLPGNKKLFVSLTAIKGIGQSLARTICADVKIDPLTKTDDVTEQQEALLRTRIERRSRKAN
jgi:small subunit ribosomal protein S13